MFASLMGLGILNVVDLGIYAYQRAQVSTAAEMGAQAAWKACDSTKLPATVNCSGLAAKITTAVQSTALGNQVTVLSGSPTEAYYCLKEGGGLQKVGEVTASKPADCSATGLSDQRPGDYIEVKVTYTYAPLFSGITATALLTGDIIKSAFMRLG